MNPKTKSIFLTACLMALSAFDARASDARVLLTESNLSKATRYFIEIGKRSPILDSGILVRLEEGGEVTHHRIRMFVDYLRETKRLPAPGDLEPLLEDKNMACRIFCHWCLAALIADLPDYSPFYPPGSEPAKIAKVKGAILKEKAKAAVNHE